MPDQFQLYAAMISSALLAGFVRGASGFGGPLILIPSLQLFLTPKASVLIALFVDLLANVRLVPDARKEASGHILWPLLLGAILGLPVGIVFLTWTAPDVARKIISGFLLVCTIVVLMGWRLPNPLQTKGLVFAGTLGGMSLGASGVSVIVPIALQAGHASVISSRANFVMWAFVVTIVALAVMIFAGLLSVDRSSLKQAAVLGAVLTPTYLLGVVSGIVLYRRINERMLRTATLWLAAAIAGVGVLF